MRRILVGLVRKVMAARTPPPSGGESPYGPYGLPWPHRAPCFPAPAEAPKVPKAGLIALPFLFQEPRVAFLSALIQNDLPVSTRQPCCLIFPSLIINLLRNPTPHPNHRCLRPLQQPRLRRTSDISPGLLSGRVPQNLSPRMRMHKASTTTSRRAREW